MLTPALHAHSHARATCRERAALSERRRGALLHARNRRMERASPAAGRATASHAALPARASPT
eukprot:5112237-Lingulodinium_polyedra.AAC.1